MTRAGFCAQQQIANSLTEVEEFFGPSRRGIGSYYFSFPGNLPPHHNERRRPRYRHRKWRKDTLHSVWFWRYIFTYYLFTGLCIVIGGRRFWLKISYETLFQQYWLLFPSMWLPMMVKCFPSLLDSYFPVLLQAEKRAHHNALERKRRDHIKDSFTSLRDSVPALQGEKVVSINIYKNHYIHILMHLSKPNSNMYLEMPVLSKRLSHPM